MIEGEEQEQDLDEFARMGLEWDRATNDVVADGHESIELQYGEAKTYTRAWLNVAAARFEEFVPGILREMQVVELTGSDTPPHGFPNVSTTAVTQPIVSTTAVTEPLGELEPTRRVTDDVLGIIAGLRPTDPE